MTSLSEWVTVPGFEDYQANRLGQIRSKNKVLKPTMHPTGYLMVGLYSGKRHYTPRVHKVIMLTFVGPRPEGMVICHGDNNKTNNRLDNLRYDTPKGNMADTYRAGLGNSMERHGSCKLTQSKVLEIRGRVLRGESMVALGKEYGVSPNAIYKVKERKTWKLI